MSGGRLVLLSTPFGRRGFFHHEWTEGGESWARVKVTAHECPRIPRAWLEAEREAIGEWWYRQEYECEFVETLDRIIYDELCVGTIRSESQKAVADAMGRLINNGAEGIVLGCTELGLLITAKDCPAPLFDTTRLHALAAVDMALRP